MTYFGYFLFIFGLIRLIVSFINWTANMYFPNNYSISNRPLVSVLIPARNEEKNIGDLLNDLISIKYQPLEIIIFDDCSTDNTSDIIQKYTSLYGNIKMISGRDLPAGWIGKNFACHNLAINAKGKKLLFVDADVRLKDKIIEKSLAYSDKHNLELLSVFPTQLMPTLGTRLVVPIMNWILLSLLPLPLIRLSPKLSLSAANGQFMFFDADTYHKILPHKLVRDNKVEDIAIIKEYKRRKLTCATLLGGDDVFCRMYSNLKEGIDGFSKNIFQFFGGSKVLTILFSVLTTISPLYLLIFNGLEFCMYYLLILILIHLLVSLSSKQSVLYNISFIIPQQIVLWQIIISAFINSKKLTWKNRNISSAY